MAILLGASLWVFAAGAESEYVDGWVGDWTVQMLDGSTETWEITHAWVSKTRKSHMVYGVKKPGNVQFQIYFGTMFKNHSYIEAGHDTAVTELPILPAEYTDLVPADDFLSFTARSGKYSIKNGVKEGAGVAGLRSAAEPAAVSSAVDTDAGAAVTEERAADSLPLSGVAEKELIDVEGNVYRTVRIGTQVWMAGNLRTKKYRDGTAIASPGSDNDAWERNREGAYSLHENDPKHEPIYGVLYNWAAVMNSRSLCPHDWHVPTDSEWQTLVDYLGGDDLAGGAMKSKTVDPAPHPRWEKPNTGANNSSGFSGTPGGLRRSNGSFREIGVYGAWWSSTDGGPGDSWHRSIFYSDTKVYHFIYGKGSGMSVRCIKD